MLVLGLGYDIEFIYVLVVGVLENDNFCDVIVKLLVEENVLVCVLIRCELIGCELRNVGEVMNFDEGLVLSW